MKGLKFVLKFCMIIVILRMYVFYFLGKKKLTIFARCPFACYMYMYSNCDETILQTDLDSKLITILKLPVTRMCVHVHVPVYIYLHQVA